MPVIGLGTYQVRDRSTIFTIVDTALDCGYRFIDTAQVSAIIYFVFVMHSW